MPDLMPEDVVSPESFRKLSGMFTRMKRQHRDDAETIANNALKPLTNGSGTAIHPAAGGDKYLLHDQPTPATTWSVTHNFARYPNVQTFDTTGDVIEGLVNHTSINALTITFNTAIDGKAVLN